MMSTPSLFPGRGIALCLGIVLLYGCSLVVHDPYAGVPGGELLSAIERRSTWRVRVALAEHPEQVNKEIMLRTPLEAAAAKNLVEIADLLLQHGADVNRQGIYEGEKMPNPLDSAVGIPADQAPYEMVKLLVDHGANVNAVMSGNTTVLHDASLRGCSAQVLNLLLSKGANVNSRCDDGTTPLHWAASGGWFEGVRILLENGADVLVRNQAGKTPLDRAMSHLRVLKSGKKRRANEIEETGRVVEILMQYEEKWEKRRFDPNEK